MPVTKRTLAVAAVVAIAVLRGTDAAAQEAPAPVESKWGFDLSAFTIDPPDDDPYVATVLRADRDELHLEGRWNYEDRHTGSFFAGRNLEWEGLWHESLDVLLVPMAGIVAGDTNGIAPGLEVGATWGMLELWSESEYVFDLDDGDDDYFYTWNEL